MRLPAAPLPQADGDPRAASVAELHIRSVIGDHSDFYATCTCGYLSLSYLTLEAAHRSPCPVEVLLAESRERERRLFARLGAGH